MIGSLFTSDPRLYSSDSYSNRFKFNNGLNALVRPRTSFTILICTYSVKVLHISSLVTFLNSTYYYG